MTLPARFPARRLLKGVSLFLGALVFGILAFVVILSITGDNSHGLVFDVVMGFVMLLPALYILKLIADSFSVLEVDEKGVRVRKWFGGLDLGWQQIGSVRYWEQIQMAYGATSREYSVELRTPEGKRLARLKSTYEPAAYVCLMEAARARNIRIDQ